MNCKPRLNSKGHALITSVIFVSIMLVFTLGYLSWSAHEKVAAKHNYAEFQAELAARTGISEKVYAGIMLNTPGKDTTFGDFQLEPAQFNNSDFNRSYVASARPAVGAGLLNIYKGTSEGKVTYTLGSRFGEDRTIEVTRKANITLTPKTFGDYLYFTNKEAAGGGAFIWNDNEDDRRAVTFGSGESWEGPVHSNDVLTMSDYGCPQFNGGLSTSLTNQGGGIDWGTCEEDDVFPSDEDSLMYVDKIIYPPPNVIQGIERDANFIFDASPIQRSGNPVDLLVMTEIEFIEGGFEVSQWTYTIPSSELAEDSVHAGGVGVDDAGNAIAIPRDSTMMVPTEWYHPSNPHGYFHHFDFLPPDSADGYLTPPTTYSTNQAVIFVRNGQVLVHGEVDGRFTIATNEKTRYSVRNPIFGSGRDVVYNNIWITDDITYIDSAPNGRVMDGSPNRLGLISGANVIIANTEANRNDVIINAGIMAFNESFVAHYWQNTCTADNAYLPSLGDARGPMRNGGATTGGGDDRGTIHLWGSIVQEYRGYVRRNAPGPYETGDIGYQKDYHYDFNFQVSPPPKYPVILTESGYTEMNVSDYSVGN